MSHNVTTDSGNPFAPPLNNWRSGRAYPNIKFSWTSILYLGTHHAHTLLYLSCPWTMLGTFFTNQSNAMDKILNCVLMVFQNQFHRLHCVHVLDLAGWKVQSSWWMPTHSWTLFTLSLQECGLSTLSPNTSIKWQWISRVEMFCLYKLSHHKISNVSTIITTAHKLFPKWHDYLIFAPSAACYLYKCQYLPPQNKRVVKKNYRCGYLTY